MLPADVGAAPAAATRYQGTSSTPAASAGRERPAAGADPFGDLVDQYADDAEPAAAGGRRAARPATRQAMTTQPQAQPLAADTPGAGSTAPNVKLQPRQDDGAPAVAVVPEVAEEVRADLVVPSVLTPFDLPRTVPAPAGAAGGGDVAADVARQKGDGAVMPGTPFLPRTWHQPTAHMPAVAAAGLEAPLDDTGIELAAAESPASPASVPLADLELPEGMPLDAASPEVLAAVRAAQAARPSGAEGPGATVSAAASNRSARTPQPAGPAAPAAPRAVAMAAVREALSQPVTGIGTSATPVTVAQPETEPAPVPAPVPQPAVAAAPPQVAPAVAAADVPGLASVAPDAAATAAPLVADAVVAPGVTAEQLQAEAAAIRTPRQAKPNAGQPQAAVSSAPLNEAVSIDETVQATPARKTAHDEQPAPAARPTARAAQAIAAFHAAAAIGATSSPAAVNAAVAGAAVSSTALLDTELPTQLIHAIRVQFDQGSGEARIRLNPGFLGGVTVGVQIDGASVTASLQAASADVREWMRTNESMLRQALADQGLQLDRLVIVDEDAPASSDEHDAHPRDEREQQAPRRQRRTADQGTFELVF